MGGSKKVVGAGQANSQPLESEILREICEFLEAERYFFWRTNNVPIFGKNNAGKFTYRAMPKYTPKGIPDIILITDGNFVGIEVKRPTAFLRPEQASFGLKVHANGGYYRRVTCVADVVSLLKDVRSYTT